MKKNSICTHGLANNENTFMPKNIFFCVLILLAVTSVATTRTVLYIQTLGSKIKNAVLTVGLFAYRNLYCYYNGIKILSSEYIPEVRLQFILSINSFTCNVDLVPNAAKSKKSKCAILLRVLPTKICLWL